MANSELLQAFSMFGQAAQGYGLSKAINQANEQAQSIKASASSESEKRRLLMDLATQSSVAVAGGGGSGIQVQALQNLSPPMPASLQGALIQGQLTGNQDLVNIASEGMQMEWERDLRKLRETARIQEGQQARAQAFTESRDDKRLAAVQAAAEAKANALSRPGATFTKDITTMDSAADTMNSVLQKLGGPDGTAASADTSYINAVGPVVGRIPSVALGNTPGGARKVAAQQELLGLFQKYRNEMTGAAFSPQESAEYERSAPSVNDSPEVLRQKLSTSLRLYQNSRARMLDNAEASRIDVRGFRAQQPISGFSKTNAAPKGASEQAQLARKFFTPSK